MDTEATPFTSKPLGNLTPRGQRFSKLSDAYFNITSRQTSNNTIHKAFDQDQPQSSTATTGLVTAAPLPVVRPRLSKSQDDLQISGSALAMPGSMKKARRASFDSVDFLEGLSRKMGRNNSSYLSFSKEIETELLSPKVKSQDTTSSTIEGILAQYNACTSSLEVGYDTSRECRGNGDVSISKSPPGPLPEPPPVSYQPTSSVLHAECDSPAPGSSITDSQHLLDVEAQAYELEEAGRALFPSPLNVAQSRPGVKIMWGKQDASTEYVVDELPVNHPFANQKVGDYKEFLRLPMERDISQQLSNISGNIGSSASKFESSDGPRNSPARKGPLQGDEFSSSSFHRVRTRERPVRHIKVVIGRESETSKDTKSSHSAQADSKTGRCDGLSEDGDWVTEATSDAGFDAYTSTLPGRSQIGGFKRAGSSIADYSDEGNEDIVERFGSRERIIQSPTDNIPYKSSDIQRLNESKFAALLPHRHNGFLESTNRRWESASQKRPGQFRPQVLWKSTNPFREIGGRQVKTPKRLVFDFDQNAPPRYEFRDSVSEYEAAAASTKANCGTNQYDTHGSLPSLVSDIGKNDHPSIADAHFDRPADFDADRNRSNRFSQASPNGQGMKLSIYAAERKKQLEDIERREFAAASSYYDPPSANSVRSKFNFELLPLNLAQQKNKRQRDSGETNETESTAVRLKRKHPTSSIDPATSLLERPATAILASRDLSINFSSNWQGHDTDIEDIPTPFSMGRFDEATPNTVSSPDTTPTRRCLWYGRIQRHPAGARNPRQYLPRSRFISPDDYVSDRADRIRRFCFYVLAVLSVLPFFGVLVLSGSFSEAFKWATQGEVDRLTFRQRRFIKIMLLAEIVFYTGIVVTIVVYFEMRNPVPKN
ncbi:hypothetical protein ONZ43_g4348 [Nemania bipapillata]|uniref:Uncharacterized protein n=1 Tax=Nemania bipapillata TaxID=110536 RepID=A0ACC2INY1_9PEZI|nr:hypothetical protein ONZ43_g4348 [Nemania bipapillata]